MKIKVDEALESDTAQLLYYYYMKGSGGMYEADTPQDVVWVSLTSDRMSGYQQGHGYIYFRGECISSNGRIAEREEKFRFNYGKASQCDACHQ